MTREQVLEQIKRLRIFGNISEQEIAEEYINTLCNIGYTELLDGITWLINNHERHSFPLPAEIKKAVKQVAYDKSMNNSAGNWGACGTVASNAEFWKAWHMVAMLKKERWEHYYKFRLGYGAPLVEGREAEEYCRWVQGEIKNELNMPATKPETKPVIINDDDLPF